MFALSVATFIGFAVWLGYSQYMKYRRMHLTPHFPPPGPLKYTPLTLEEERKRESEM